jgi:AraC family transcriptional regulator
MTEKIIDCAEKIVIGMSSKMKDNEYHKISELWQKFMPRKKEIKNTNSNEFIAIQIYTENIKLHPNAYDIWACVEVSTINEIPNEMKSFKIPAGTYAVFQLKGMDIFGLYQRIMQEWLPNSDFQIDNRPHYQVMGDMYKNGSPDSEEEVYVPIKPSKRQE